MERLFGLKYEIPEEGFWVSESRIVCGVDERYFYLNAFASGLRFPFLNFMVKVLRAYNVMPSQLHLNCLKILGPFFLGCWENDVVPTFGIFRRFYSLKRKEGYFFQSRGRSW